MAKKHIPFIMLLLLMVPIFVAMHGYSKNELNYQPIEKQVKAAPYIRVVLLPLDSRPPCTQFVEQLGRIANIEIISPPYEMLDYYKNPADKNALRNWLLSASKNADAAIISVDMLVHGGLLASRHSVGTSTDYTAVTNLLKTIHHENPSIKLYAFNIIPRLLLADSKENVIFQRDMVKYSTLKDQIVTFENPIDIQHITRLEEKIPREVIDQYNLMYEQNNRMNYILTDMVRDGILTGLVIGQDDGQPFGIPNINKKRIQDYVAQQPALQDKVWVTRGTDEVALTLLGRLANDYWHYQPKIHVIYSDENTARLVMPYMPYSIASTVTEKIQLMNGIIVDDADVADFVLYVHAGTKNNTKHLPVAASEIKQLLSKNYKIALVDLSEKFTAEQIILPHLLNENISPVNLIAYAGWNTTSNSIGTALTEATLFSQTVRNKSPKHVIQAYQDNLEFLISRLIDDWYYQKDVQPLVNKYLKFRKIDPYNLGIHYLQTDILIRKLMLSQSYKFATQHIIDQPIILQTDQGQQSITITKMYLQTSLPWPRTFELWVKPSLSFMKLAE